MRNLATVDSTERIIVSCKGSTVRFVGEAVLLGLVVVVTRRWVAGWWLKGGERRGGVEEEG